jgi:hypothetical protein
MKKFIVPFVLFLTAISFTACNDSSDEDVAQDSKGDYWPTSIDNNWVYDQDGAETSIKIIGSEVVNGTKYYKFNQLDIFGRAVEDHPPFRIKKNKGDYYINVGEINITAQGVTTKITGYEFLLFKDYLNINETWEGNYTYTISSNAANPFFALTEVTYTGKILEKGISLTVNGTVFNDVIRFRFTQIIDGKSDAWPTWDYSTDYWIAKDVGIIRFSNDGAISEHKSHVIK